MLQAVLLYEHIYHMFYTTIPATIVSLIVYAIAGMNADTTVDASSQSVTTLLSQLDVMYHWNLLLLLPVVMVLAGSIMKKTDTACNAGIYRCSWF